MYRINIFFIFFLTVALSYSSLYGKEDKLNAFQESVPAYLTENARLLFLENKGQIKDQYGQVRNDIDFILKAGRVNIYLGKGKVYYIWSNNNYTDTLSGLDSKEVRSQYVSTDLYRLELNLQGIDTKTISCNGQDIDSYFEQYLSNGNAIKARSFQKVTYENIYPNIDWVFYINEKGKLEHDFIVHPGGRLADIQMKYEGSTTIAINDDGSLTVKTPLGSLVESAPYSYAIGTNGEQLPVKSSFVLQDGVLGFHVASYSSTLVIDPTLEWGTFFGGTASDANPKLALDRKGNIYMAGQAGESHSSVPIATPNAYQTRRGGDGNFLVKFDSKGKRLWATFYGNTNDWWENMSGDIYVTTDPYDHVYLLADSALAKFDGSGKFIWEKRLIVPANYHSYAGGGIVCDSKGNLLMAGNVTGNYPIATPGAHQSFLAGGSDLFLVKYDSSGTRMWGTYLGGTKNEKSYYSSIAVDPGDNVYISAFTYSDGSIAVPASQSGIATKGCHQDTLGGLADVFLVKFDKDGKRLWGTYYGGEGYERGGVVTCDAFGNVFLLGEISENFPVSLTGIASENAWQPKPNKGRELFLVKFDGSGKRIWGTYFGSEGNEGLSTGDMLACDKYGNVFIYGVTNSPTGIATPGAFQETIMTGNINSYLLKFSSAGLLQWGTYFGGKLGTGISLSMVVDTNNNIFLSGMVGNNPAVVTPGSFQPVYGGGYVNAFGGDLFLAKFSEACGVATPGRIEGDFDLCINGGQVAYSVPPVPGVSAYTWHLPVGWKGNSNTTAIDIVPGNNSGLVGISGITGCGNTGIYWQQVNIHNPTPVIAQNNSRLHCGVFHTYQWYLNGELISGGKEQFLTLKATGVYTVVVTDEFGCSAVSEPYSVSATDIQNYSGFAEQIFVYPNPAKNTLNVTAPVTVNVVLMGMDGKQIMKKNDGRIIDISALTDGLYILKILDKEDRLIRTEKVIKLTH